MPLNIDFACKIFIKLFSRMGLNFNYECVTNDRNLCVSLSASPLPSPMRSPAKPPQPQQPCCVAVYDFDAENPGELGFKVI